MPEQMLEQKQKLERSEPPIRGYNEYIIIVW